METLKPPFQKLHPSAIKPPQKVKLSIYETAAFKEWRSKVVARAGGRCQAIEDGVRCPKSQPKHRMYADHIRELRDGGHPFDLANGQCLCSHHHQLKTHAERRARPDHAWSGNISRPRLPKPNCRVMLVCGPPAAGKSTFVRNNAAPDDIVVDLDLIARNHGYDRARPDTALTSLLRERNNLLAALATQPAQRTAWVIVGAPTQRLRQWWCDALHVQPCDVVLLLPSRAELHRRVMNDPDRNAVADLHVLWIDRWIATETGQWPR